MRILIIEDEYRLAGTLAELLRRQGYTADICPSCAEHFLNLIFH